MPLCCVITWLQTELNLFLALTAGSEQIGRSRFLFFFSNRKFPLRRRGERRPLAMLLLGAINGNVSRLSKWWDLTYGIKASLDLHLVQMESALSQGAQHRGEAYWVTGKDKMTGNTQAIVWITIHFNGFKEPRRPRHPMKTGAVILFDHFQDYYGCISRSKDDWGTWTHRGFKVRVVNFCRCINWGCFHS